MMTRTRDTNQHPATYTTVGLSLLSAVLFSLLAFPAVAQPGFTPPAFLDDIGVEEQLGDTLPLDLVFQNEAGEDVTLAEYFDGERPVMLQFVYLTCTTMCNLHLQEVTRTLGEMEWVPGGEFDVLTISFDATEDATIAAAQKQAYVDRLGKPEAAEGWHFLTGSEASIQALTAATGFKFVWLPEIEEFAHASTLIFMSGEGVISRYIHGMLMPPQDVRFALLEAGQGKVGTVTDQLLLYCFQYDPLANSYVLHATNLMKIAGLLTVLILGGVLLMFWRRERRNLDAATA
ncbi:MAG: SCO family protein [Rhodothermales bacterium]